MRSEQAEQLLRQQLLFAQRQLDTCVDGPSGLGAKQASLLSLNVGLVVYIDVVCNLVEKAEMLSRTRQSLLAKAGELEVAGSEGGNFNEILSLFQQDDSWLSELACVVDSVYEHPAKQEQGTVVPVGIIARTGQVSAIHWSKVSRERVQHYVHCAKELLQRHTEFGCEY